MNFINDGKLATMQDSIFDRYLKNERIPEREITLLEENFWIKLADFLAPCNLVIRHYCLIDLLRKYPLHMLNIECQLKILASKNIYIEGYSYWLYIKKLLSEYAKVFKCDALKITIKDIDINFIKTSYINNGIKFPAPFGDLRHEPLEDSLQKDIVQIPDEITIDIIKKTKSKYIISPYIVGFNLHTPKIAATYKIIDGQIIDSLSGKEFKWYTGYKNKYPTRMSEIKDMLLLKRFISFLKH